MEYSELTQVYPTWVDICQKIKEEKIFKKDYETKLIINKCIINPGERLRIVNGELEVDKRSSFMRTFSMDSRHSLLNFLQKNKALLTQKMFDHLKNLYKNDSKFVSSLEKEFGILKNVPFTSNIVGSLGTNYGNSKISLKEIKFSTNYKEHGKLRIINDKIQQDTRSSFMRMLSRDSRWNLLKFLKDNTIYSDCDKKNINGFVKHDSPILYYIDNDHQAYHLKIYLKEVYSTDLKFQEELNKI